MDTSCSPGSLQPSTLPEGLPNLRWAVGNKEWDPKRDKYVKPPRCPRTGRHLPTNKPEQWLCSFAEALEAKERKGYDFIGFLLTKEDDVHLTDLDEVRDPEAEEIDERASKILKERRTYAEYSLSGTGFHSIGRGKKPDGQKKKFVRDGLEVEDYDDLRFVVFTGNPIEGYDLPLTDVQSWIDGVPVREKNDAPVESRPVDVSDEEILQVLVKTKREDDFTRLFEEGNTKDYASASEADMALCGMLAWATRRDAERTDRLFRSSALFRGKWDKVLGEKTYGQWTIEKAISGCTSIFSPPREELDALAVFRMKVRWKNPSLSYLYRAHLSVAYKHGRRVEKGQVVEINGETLAIPEDGIVYYASIRTISPNTGYMSRGAISKGNREIEGMGLIHMLLRGRGKKASIFLLPYFSDNEQRETQGGLQVSTGPSVTNPCVSLCPIMENLPWMPDLSYVQRLVVEIVAWGMKTLSSLADHFGVTEKTMRYKHISLLLKKGIVFESEEGFEVSEENLRNEFEGTGAEARRLHLIKIEIDRADHEAHGEDANNRDSGEKVVAYLVGEIGHDDLDPWEREKAEELVSSGRVATTDAGNGRSLEDVPIAKGYKRSKKETKREQALLKSIREEEDFYARYSGRSRDVGPRGRGRDE